MTGKFEPEDAETLYQRGQKYEHGKGVVQDLNEAGRWYHKAAEQGHVRAQYELGNWMLFKKNDLAEAAKWYHKAAEQGHELAQYTLGNMAEDPAEAMKWYRKAAEQGNPRAIQILKAYRISGRI